jgi:hypothetical protein
MDLVFQKGNGLLPDLMLAMVFGFDADTVGILPQYPTGNQISGEQFQLDNLLVSNQGLDLTNAGKTGNKLLRHGVGVP